eukprot:COSAG01_NODE_141_length_24253_cov_36.101130_23_plen_369_part_00
MTEVQQLMPVAPSGQVTPGAAATVNGPVDLDRLEAAMAPDEGIEDGHATPPLSVAAAVTDGAAAAAGEKAAAAATDSDKAGEEGQPQGSKVLDMLLKTDTIGGKIPLLDPSTLEEGAEVDYNPGMHPKSIPGVICSNFWLLVYLALVCVLVMRLADSENVGAVAGDEAWLWFNHHCAETDAELAKMLAMDDRPVIKLPTFKVRVSAQLTQFEDDSPSLQKLQLVDDTGYMRHPMTSHLDPIPGVKSVAQKIKLPLNGFDERLSRVPPHTPVAADDVDSTFARAAAHRFTSETLKARYQELGIFEAGQSFYPHTAHLFARLDPTQLKNLKSCQLQFFMANSVRARSAAAGLIRRSLPPSSCLHSAAASR